MKIYTFAEFAKLVKVHKQTLQRWDREGTLKAHRTKTGRRYYTETQLQEYLGAPSCLTPTETLILDQITLCRDGVKFPDDVINAIEELVLTNNKK